jgi:hypothetical protein
VNASEAVADKWPEIGTFAAKCGPYGDIMKPFLRNGPAGGDGFHVAPTTVNPSLLRRISRLMD